jgi:hypothetical protein
VTLRGHSPWPQGMNARATDQGCGRPRTGRRRRFGMDGKVRLGPWLTRRVGWLVVMHRPALELGRRRRPLGDPDCAVSCSAFARSRHDCRVPAVTVGRSPRTELRGERLSEWDSANEIRRVDRRQTGRSAGDHSADTDYELETDRSAGPKVTGASATAIGIKGPSGQPQGGMHQLLVFSAHRSEGQLWPIQLMSLFWEWAPQAKGRRQSRGTRIGCRRGRVHSCGR